MKPARREARTRRRRAKGKIMGRVAGLLAGRLIADRLRALLVHNAAHGLYSEALIDEDGGQSSSTEYAARCEAATETLRELYAEFALPAELIPSQPATRREAERRLRRVLEHEERQALTVLESLGPSRRIDHRGAPADYYAAAEAEDTLSHVAGVLAYLDRALLPTRPASEPPAPGRAYPDHSRNRTGKAA